MKGSKVVHYMQIPLDIKPNESTKTCFIVYSSWETHIDITIDAIETVLESTGKYNIKRLATHGISGHSQYSQLLEFLDKCSLAIIILDGFRPNVLFEYGVLVGLRKPCIVLLEQNGSINIQSFLKAPVKKLPIVPIDMDKDFSDVKDQMYVKYRYNDPKKLREIIANEISKIEPLVEETHMKLMFPEIDYIEKEVKDSLAVFSEICNSNNKLTHDDEVRFRVSVKEIEKITLRNNIKLTNYYYYEKVQILINFDKYDEANQLIEELIIEFSNDTQLLLLKSYVLNMLGKHELAIECLNRAIKIDDKNETLWHQKALLLERLDRKEEAAFCYKKGVDFNDGCASIHYHYGVLLLDNNDVNEALLQFNKALKIHPAESDYLVCKAICLNKLGKSALAKKAITDAICFDENNADAWFQLGKLTSNPQESLKHFDKCLSIDSTHSGALCSRGAELSNIGQLDEACIELQKAISCCSKYGGEGCDTAQGNLGRTKYKLYKTGRLEYREYDLEAIEHFNKAVNCSDNKDEIEEFLNSIGYMYLSSNNISEARNYFIKANNLDFPDSGRKSIILYNLALTYLIEGDVYKAKELLSSTVDLSRKMKPSERKCYCLLIPEVNNSIIHLSEQNTDPDIYECAKLAINVCEMIEL